MLASKFRLRKKEEVNSLFRRGESVSLSEFALRFRTNSLGLTRVAVLVGVKLSKKAVVRNKIKRRLREVARLHFDQIPVGLDLLIIAREIKLREMEFGELNKKFLDLIAKLPNFQKNKG